MVRLAPRSVRLTAARARAALIRLDVVRTLRRVARSGRPVLAGPWLGEVGFELAYWVPFLRWAVETAGLPASSVIAMSRGGVASWYHDVSGRYEDALAYLGPVEFRRRNDARRAEIGEQKQLRTTGLEADLRARLERDVGRPVELLHPSLMYRLMQPYWWGHEPIPWVFRHARFARLAAPDPVGLGVELPKDFAAVKFYFNDCFPRTAANEAFVKNTVDELRAKSPVVLLSTRLRVDDHDDAPAPEGCIDLASQSAFPPESNLAIQTAVLGRARRFVGTYGGFCYLAPFLGVETTAFWSDGKGFDPHHLRLVQKALGNIKGGQLTARSTTATGVAV